MFTKNFLSVFALTSVLAIPSVAKADPVNVQVGNLRVFSEAAPGYRVEINGSNSRICVNGTCSYYYNCPAISALKLPQNLLRSTLEKRQSTQTFCRSYRRTPIPGQFSQGTSKTTRIYQSQTQFSNGGVTQINRAQSIIRSK